MSAGNWGKLTLEQAGFRLFVARDVSTGAAAAARLAGLPVIGLDAIAVRRVLDKVSSPQSETQPR